MQIELKTLKGFLIGAISSRFQKICKLYPTILEDEDEWRYISLVTKDAATYDFKFAKLKDATEFIMTVSSTIQRLNKKHPRASHGAVTMLLLRAKLEKMARKRKSSLHGLLSRALFLTVS